ncbi:MAG: discoidin domain-containing protein, partial [Planctomycetota bacterium]
MDSFILVRAPATSAGNRARLRFLFAATCLLIATTSGLLFASEASTAAYVTASSIHSTPYPAYFAVDGKGDTRWASRSFQVGDPQWLTIDFGRPVSITGLRIHWERAFAAAYSLRISDDGAHWNTVYEQPDGRGNIEEITSLSARGRFLQLYCTKPGPFGLVSVWELEFMDPAVRACLAERQQAILSAKEKELAVWKADALRRLAS